ncbi:MAG: thiamine phosphate synthase [Phycisphaeraceae bacterium]
MGDVLRAIDANANRASEGLRTLEDVARFVLNREDLSREAKGLRHELRGLLAGVEGLAWHRDTTGDVGTGIRTVREGQREDVAGIAEAAGYRVAEALRVIEEFGKLVGEREGCEELAGGAEGLRYRVYELQRKVVVALGSGRGCQWGVCLLLTESACLRPWREVLGEAVAAGVDCVQVREKGMNDRALLERVREVVGVARPAGAAVVVNDRADVALAAGADGVHLGQGDLSVGDVRRMAGRRLVVGVSTSRVEEAREAEDEGADYVGLGPMFVSMTKAKPVVAGPGYLRAYLEAGRLPHLAIGGITAGNVGELVAAGALGVAVCAAIAGADEPGAAARGLVEAFRGAS